MGVQIYLLDRRNVTLVVDHQSIQIGTVRRSWKVTEIDDERAKEINAAKASLAGREAPLAVMIADVVGHLPLASEPGQSVEAHMVIGWDADRSSVTDFGWDYLPVLGYAIRNPNSAAYTLHEEKMGVLYRLTFNRAVELGVLDQAGSFVRRGQPSIIECRSVQTYISAYAQADCVLSDGRAAEILTAVEPGNLPDRAWYAGKRPADVTRYPLASGEA